MIFCLVLSLFLNGVLALVALYFDKDRAYRLQGWKNAAAAHERQKSVSNDLADQVRVADGNFLHASRSNSLLRAEARKWKLLYQNEIYRRKVVARLPLP